MQIQFQFDQATYKADLSQGTDLSITLKAGPEGVNCFWAPMVEYWPVKADGFVGSTAEGGLLNFFNIKCNPHGNGTHTECVGHITKAPYKLNDCFKDAHCMALLVSVFPEKMDNGDRVITLRQIEDLTKGTKTPPALIIRTLPNHEDKKSRQYSGTNPPYLQADAAVWMAQNGVEHLLLDLPSVDREEDEGKLAAHKAFWNYPEQPRTHCTISELLFIPDEVRDGLYLLNIQTAPFDIDASPSRPVVYPVERA